MKCLLIVSKNDGKAFFINKIQRPIKSNQMKNVLEINQDTLAYFDQHQANQLLKQGFGFLYGVEEVDWTRVLLLAEASDNTTLAYEGAKFKIAQQSFVKAEQRALALGLSLLGIYYSADTYPKIPSEYNRQQALSYLSLSRDKKNALKLTSWRLNESTYEFEQEIISIDPATIVQKELA
jgi:proteasome lid subunit RPN8/RPN11